MAAVAAAAEAAHDAVTRPRGRATALLGATHPLGSMAGRDAARAVSLRGRAFCRGHSLGRSKRVSEVLQVSQFWWEATEQQGNCGARPNEAEDPATCR